MCVQQPLTISRAQELEKIQKLNNAPIKKDILGEWSLVSSTGTEIYLKKKNLGLFFNNMFLSTNQLFNVKGREVTQTQMIGDQVVANYTSRIGFETRRQQFRCKTTVEVDGSVLQTKETVFLSAGMGKTYDVEMRYVMDDKLHIVNYVNQLDIDVWSTARCERVYKKVNQFERMVTTIREELEGQWKPVCKGGAFHDYCKAMNLAQEEKNSLKNGKYSFNVLKFFNEVHSNHFFGNVWSTKKTFRLDEDYSGFLTSFKNNELVTEGQGIEIIRFVKDGKLFITNSKNGKKFMTVYVKM